MKNMRGLRTRLVTGLALCGVCGVAATTGTAAGRTVAVPPPPTTPIKHVVVIFGENIFFDHYFGTYGKEGTPGTIPHGTVNGLANTPGAGGSGTLLTNNPNLDSSNNRVNPRRLDPTNINGVL